jgi:Zn finger protein HypA/HybF involved in hydrogenase expression
MRMDIVVKNVLLSLMIEMVEHAISVMKHTEGIVTSQCLTRVARGTKEGKMSDNICNFMKCPQCGSTTDQIIPAVSGDTKERYYCTRCQQHFYAIYTGAGTTIQPDKYLVRER